MSYIHSYINDTHDGDIMTLGVSVCVCIVLDTHQKQNQSMWNIDHLNAVDGVRYKWKFWWCNGEMSWRILYSSFFTQLLLACLQDCVFMSSRFTRQSWRHRQRCHHNLEDIGSDVISKFKSLTTHMCVARRNGLNSLVKTRKHLSVFF